MAQVPVKCVPAVYEASWRSGRLSSVKGRVTDIMDSFDLDGTYPGGTATLSFKPDAAVETPSLEGIVVPYVVGSCKHASAGSGAKVNGDGCYTIEGTLGEPLTLKYSGDGCPDPGGGAPKVCQKTNGEITLTPVQP